MRDADVRPIWVLAALAAGALLVGVELLVDEETFSPLEFVVELVEKTLVVVGAGGVWLLVGRLREERGEQLRLARELEVARTEGIGWRTRVQAHVAGIGAEIERQFLAWGLTEAESEVGLLVLKGLSHKDIGALRGTAEATVRQQARSVYQKSGLPGKTAFSAYFLEDLLPPGGLRGARPESPATGATGSATALPEPAPGFSTSAVRGPD